MPFILDNTLLPKGSNMGKYTIKVPVAWGAEIVKDYPEKDGKKLLMSFDEIKNITKTHSEFTITQDHIFMGTRESFAPITHPIGKIRDLKADPKCRCGRGMAYINKNKIPTYVGNMLLRGGVIGVSIGGFATKYGPGGNHKGENYDATQMGIKVHHAALVTVGIAKCPNNLCGFNLKESFTDSSENILSKKISILAKENPSWTQAQKIAVAFEDYKNESGINDSFKFPNKTPLNFIEYYEYLISENTISREPCVNDFYKEFQNAWNDLETIRIKNEKGHILDNNLNLNKNKVEKNMAENQDLLDAIAMLQAENKSLKDAKLKDTEGINDSLKAENEKLKADYAKLHTVIDNFQSAEMEVMKKTMIDSKRYTAEELNPMDYKTLKDSFEVAKRFLDLQNVQVVAPQLPPVQQFAPPLMNQAQYYNQPIKPASTIAGVPQPQVPGQIPGYYDAAGRPLIQNPAPGQTSGGSYKIPLPGQVPSPQELYDSKNPRWNNPGGETDDPRGTI